MACRAYDFSCPVSGGGAAFGPEELPKLFGPDDGATPEALKYIGFTEEELQTFQPRKGGGCAACEGSGYKGRQGIYEVLRVTPQVEEAILKQAQAPEIWKRRVMTIS